MRLGREDARLVLNRAVDPAASAASLLPAFTACSQSRRPTAVACVQGQAWLRCQRAALRRPFSVQTQPSRCIPIYFLIPVYFLIPNPAAVQTRHQSDTFTGRLRFISCHHHNPLKDQRKKHTPGPGVSRKHRTATFRPKTQTTSTKCHHITVPDNTNN